MRRSRDPFADVEPFAFGVFVPAVMSAGLLFSILTLVRDAFAGRRHRGGRRRAAVAAAAVAADVLDAVPPPSQRGLRPRRFYLVAGFGLAVGAAYLAPGALLNYAHAGGYVSDIAWLLVTSLLVAVLSAAAAAVAFATWWRWPEPPAVVRRTIAATPLAAEPGSRAVQSGGPDPALGGAAFAFSVAFVALAVGVAAGRSGFARLDDSIRDAVSRWDTGPVLEAAALVGRTPVAIVLALLVGAATWRCRPLAVAWATAVLGSLAIDAVVKGLIQRPRPVGSSVTGLDDSFPSGHVVQATLLAVVVPLAVRELGRRRWLERVVGTILAFAAAVTALERVQEGSHWPTDVLGGALLGIAAGLWVHWARSSTSWHTRCRSCTYSAAGPPPPARRSPTGLIPISAGAARWLRWIGTGGLVLAVATLVLLTRVAGLPVDPEGEGMLSAVEEPAQLVLLAVAAVGGLLERRWPAAGLAVVAVAAVGLGLVASVEHPPIVTIGVTAALGVPAVLLWLSWQHRQPVRRISIVAVLAAALVTGQAVGAARVHDHFFGPAHPESTTPVVPVDRVDWAWVGDLRPDGATVVAEVEAARAGLGVTLILTGPDGRARQVATGDTDGDGIVRLRAAGLAPSTTYRWVIEVDGFPDAGRGQGELRTAPDGAARFILAAGSCARTGSDGAVYDAIRGADPLLYLISGDLHYRNLTATSTGPYLAAYRQVLTSPAQAALYREVPVDYVWDDHDYGGNDADATSPGRESAQAAYRQAVPHGPLASDGPIFHASTIGRVRIIVSDTRSARTDATMLGPEQLDWLLAELGDADRYGLVVWVNPDPWIAPDDPGRDDWGAYAAERRTIADSIASNGVDNLVMVSGDAHMVAIDDGTNSDFSSTGGGGFPILHAAALDRPGNVKGGPYSDGAFPGGGQFGLLHVDDDGARVTVRLEGLDWTGDVLVSRTFVMG